MDSRPRPGSRAGFHGKDEVTRIMTVAGRHGAPRSRPAPDLIGGRGQALRLRVVNSTCYQHDWL